MPPLVLAFPDSITQARHLANRLQAEYDVVRLHQFPDGESLVTLPPALPYHVIIFRSLDHPNSKLVELMFCAETARNLGARRLTLVAPYLCYMRQDIANHPGEAISQRITGKMLAELFDDVITVDPHLHRIKTLNEAIPLNNALAVSAAAEISGFLKTKFDHALLVGPDSESWQWVAEIADRTGFDFSIAEKIRHGDKNVEITLEDRHYQSAPVVIIDDMASTGHTLSEAIRLLDLAGAEKIYAVVTHALFCGNAEQNIMNSGARKIWTTDSITHSNAVIKLDKLLSEAILSIL